MQAEVN